MQKEDVIKIVGKDKEYLFDEFMGRHTPIIMRNEVHYPDNAIKDFLEIHGGVGKRR